MIFMKIYLNCGFPVLLIGVYYLWAISMPVWVRYSVMYLTQRCYLLLLLLIIHVITGVKHWQILLLMLIWYYTIVIWAERSLLSNLHWGLQ